MEAVNNGGIRGSCAICQNNLSMNEKVSALLCGHTFHFSCVAQWLQVKSVCPNCRKKVNSKNGLIDKLYFDVLDTDATSTSSEAISDAERADKLVEDLLKIRMEKAEKDKMCEELQKEVKALEKKVIREKERFKKEIPALKARNQHLEMMESDYEATVKELHQANAKLKASEFYRILFEKHAEGVDQAMQKFLKDNGELEMETFFQTMKKQNNSLKIEKNEAVKEAERLRNELRPMKKEINEKINIIQALRKEVEDLRKMADTNTPINKRLRSILMNPETPVDSSQKRKSMGFDETNRLIQSDELSFFEEEKRKKRKIENATNLDETFIEEKLRRNKKIGKNLNFDEEEEEEENDEDFDDSPIFKKFTKKKMTKNAENAENEKEENFLDFSFDICVPEAIKKRVPLMAEKKKNGEKKEEKMKTKKTSGKSSRISSFFPRSSEPSTSRNENVVIID